MSEHEHIPLSEEALDRALDDALTVQPSPEFVARIRTQLAVEPPRTSWSAGWLAPAAGLLALVVVVVASMSTRWPDGPGSGPDPTTAAALVSRALPAQLPLTSPPAVPSAGGVLPAPPSRDPVAVREPRPSRAAVTEVLISEQERQGFALLLAQLERGSLPSVPEDVPATEDTVLTPISIEAIVLDAMPSFDSEEGETR
jgi:hypothetical protein